MYFDRNVPIFSVSYKSERLHNANNTDAIM